MHSSCTFTTRAESVRVGSERDGGSGPVRCDGRMADVDSDDGRETALLSRAHRVVRALDRTEGPFAGTLVTAGDAVAVRVDAAALGGWVGWRYAGAEHVAAPFDVSRRGGGQDVLLPWCTDRVLGFLVRRAAGGAALTPGECCTLVISLLRGLDEVGAGFEETRSGVWWLTDGGRPVFVFGEGSDIRAGAGEIIARLAGDSRDKVLTRALGAVQRGMEKANAQPRLPRKLLEAWERELLEVASPQPLDRGMSVPERAREVARAAGVRETETPQGRQRLRADRVPSRPGRGVVDRVRAFGGAVGAAVGAGLARAVAFRGAITGRRAISGSEPAPVRGHRRRTSLIVAAAAAGIVLAAGLLWPDGGTSGEAADTPRREPTSSPPAGEGDVAPSKKPDTEERAGEDDAVTESPEQTRQGEPADDDPQAAASALLGTIAECRAVGDLSCAGGVAPGSEGVLDALESVDRRRAAFELVDEYGDVAVVRLTGGGASDEGDPTPQERLMLVLIRVQEKWLVRDVYDVADQPG